MITAEDHLAILALYADYNRAVDGGDAAAWAACFIENGIFYHPARNWTGQDELRQFVTERSAKLDSAPVAEQRHWNDGIRIEGDGDRTTGSCDLLVAGVLRDDGKPKVVARGRYEDILERGAAGWRFVERRLTVL